MSAVPATLLSRGYRAPVEKVVATGEWLYDGSTRAVTRIVRLDYDFWYAIAEADGELEEAERPALNDQGFLYYVRHRPGWSPGQQFWPDGQGFDSVDEAKAAAEARVPGAITWQ
jgi:hypothetical protein